MTRREGLLLAAGLVLVLLLAASGVRPYDRATWLMEVAPILIALPVLALTARRFPLSPVLYILIFGHALILIGGGKYTYARVPFGLWLQEIASLSRNPYDKIGHFAQGLVPALLAREILIRGRFVARGRMAAALSMSVALAISALYELVEWGAALALGQGAEEFLGTQGDPWDTQSDMFMALIGAALGLVAFSRLQDTQMELAAESTGRSEGQPR